MRSMYNTSASVTSNSIDNHKKKRVGKACDSCRLKKTKCNGKQPCERCTIDNKICIYTERKKSKDKVYSSEYVELIDKRLKLVNKSLLKLCELIKLNKVSDLQKFASNLDYNDLEDSCPISVNQAISLLINENELDHDLNLDSDNTNATAANNTTTTTKNKNNKKIIPPILPSENKSNISNLNLVLSSPESLSPNSVNVSPNLNSLNDNLNKIPLLSKINEESNINTTINTTANDDINDNDNVYDNNENENENENDNTNRNNTNNFALSPYDSVASDYQLNNINNLGIQSSFDLVSNSHSRSYSNSNSNLVSPVDDLDDVAMMGFNSLNLAQFHSNSFLNNSSTTTSNNTTNSLFSSISPSIPIPMNNNSSNNNSSNNNNNNSNNNNQGYFSPSSVTSDSSALLFANDSINSTTPILLANENSFADFLSISPPVSLLNHKSNSSSFNTLKKINKPPHLHHHHSNSGSHNHIHNNITPYKVLNRTKSDSNTINSLDLTMSSTLTNDEFIPL